MSSSSSDSQSTALFASLLFLPFATSPFEALPLPLTAGFALGDAASEPADFLAFLMARADDAAGTAPSRVDLASRAALRLPLRSSLAGWSEAPLSGVGSPCFVRC